MSNKDISKIDIVELMLYQSELIPLKDKLTKMLNNMLGNVMYQFDEGTPEAKKVERMSKDLIEKHDKIHAKLVELDKVIGRAMINNLGIDMAYDHLLESVQKADKFLFAQYQKSIAAEEKRISNEAAEMKVVDSKKDIVYDKK